MPQKIYIVDLTEEERNSLRDLIKKGKPSARKVARAHILLLADEGATDKAITSALHVGKATVERTRKRFVEGNLERALNEDPRPGRERKLDAKQEGFLVATACSTPPAGRHKWTMQLLADRMVELQQVDTLSDETVRRTLKKNALKPWLKKEWCIPTVSADYVWHMEDVLDLYAEPEDPKRPRVCFDECPYQLISEVRRPLPAKPGRPERYDCEYKREATCNLFMFVQPHVGWRHVKVTEQRTKSDFAQCMKDLVDLHFPEADLIRVILDNLNTHTPAALYQAFEPAEARRIIRKLEFHFTPKHGSWLNMAEIEFSVLAGQCLDRRLPDRATVGTEVAAWETARNAERASINWRFTTEKARSKLERLYPP